MLSLLSILTLAQAPALPNPERLPPPEAIPPQEMLRPQEELPSIEILQSQEVRPLPGQLDNVPVFNSNSPEVVLTEGVLLSTFPPDGKRFPTAHLNFAFQGRFDLFSHHISRAATPEQTRTLFQGILVYNPSDQPVTIDILQAASYLTRPDALFVNLPSYLDNPLGTIFAGPGSRVTSDILRGRRQGNWQPLMLIPPGQSQMLMNLPIPAGLQVPTSNGRSTLMRLWSSGPVYIANLAMFAPQTPDKTERAPTLDEWQQLLVNGDLAGPRDLPPTPPATLTERVIYGRVAGVAQGSQWQAQLTDSPNGNQLSVPKRGRAISYALSTLYRGTFGTGQVQSARMLVRYPDTAYMANGNYGIHYDLTLPLRNTTRETQTVALSIETPLKQDRSKSELLFLKPPDDRIFFRGTVRIRYVGDDGNPRTRYIHLVQRRGQQGEPLVVMNMPPGDRRLVQVDFLYPPDATPPQVLTIRSLTEPAVAVIPDTEPSNRSQR